MSAKQDTMKRTPLASDAEMEADPLRQSSVHAPPKGFARVWFYPSRNIRGSAFRDIDPKSMLRKFVEETGTDGRKFARVTEILELDIWKAKLSDEHGMAVQSIILPTGKILRQGDKAE